MKIDIGFAEEVVGKALKGGADQAEIFIRTARNLAVEIKDGSVDSLKSLDSFGYSLRIIKKGCLGFSYSTDARDGESVIRDALESAEYSDNDIYLDLPEASGISKVEVFDPALKDITEEQAVKSVQLIEKSVYDEDKRIRKVRKASGSFSSSETAIVNSKSIRAGYSATSCSAQVTAVAEEGGESQIGWEFEGSRFLKDISFEDTGRSAARRAALLLGSRRIAGLKTHVILDNSVAVDFLGIFASSLSSDAVQKGKSLLAGKLNRKVVSQKINMVDSGLLNGKLGSSPVDDEGVSSMEKTVISEGVLTTYLFNTYTAKKAGALSTGNAVRGGFSSLPSVGSSNFFIKAVSKSDCMRKEKIFSLADKGLYVVDAMGVHTANPISGDFSVGVSGVWIEGGEPRYPVKEAVISGNILDLFNKIEALGDDIRFYGHIGSPSLMISDVDVSA